MSVHRIKSELKNKTGCGVKSFFCGNILRKHNKENNKFSLCKAGVYILTFLKCTQELLVNSVPLRPVSAAQGAELGCFCKVILFYRCDEFMRKGIPLQCRTSLEFIFRLIFFFFFTEQSDQSLFQNICKEEQSRILKCFHDIMGKRG